MTTAAELKAWFDAPRRSNLSAERVMELYFSVHPRTVFLKMLPAGAKVVDIGAGDGSLSVFLRWLEPKRSDLRLWAYAMDKGRLFDDFEGYALSDWNAAPPEFGATRFDAMLCSHFIEHVAEPASLVAWAERKLAATGRIYLEWPSPHALGLPPRAELERLGMPLVISRFDDDGTHRLLPDADAMVAAFERAGFSVEARGLVHMPWLEGEMLAHFRESPDPFPRQAAFWSHTRWSQYLVLRRDPPDPATREFIDA